MVRKLAKEKVEPGAAVRDQKGEFSWEMVELIRENGLFGVDFPEEHGGSGAGLLSLIIVVEELSKVDASAGILPVGQELGSLPILLAANPEQKKKFLPASGIGGEIGGFCPDRGQRRIGCGRIPVQGDPQRGFLHPQRE